MPGVAWPYCAKSISSKRPGFSILVVVLTNLRGLRQIASLGSLVVIGSLALDPLSQQLVLYSIKERPDPHGSASVPVVKKWSENGVNQNLVMTSAGTFPLLIHIYETRLLHLCAWLANPQPYNFISSAMKGAVKTGLFSGTTIVDHIAPSCSNANCTFPTYQSLAVCISSSDVSSHLKKEILTNLTEGEGFNVTRFSLAPNNYLEDSAGIPGLANISTATISNPYAAVSHDAQPLPLNFTHSIAFNNATTSSPIADFFLIYKNVEVNEKDAPQEIVAEEIIFEWCLQTYLTTVINGTAKTTCLPNAIAGFQSDGVYLTPNENHVSNPTWGVDLDTHYSLQRYLFSLFKGEVTENFARLFATTDAVQALYEPFNNLTGNSTLLYGAGTGKEGSN